MVLISEGMGEKKEEGEKKSIVAYRKSLLIVCDFGFGVGFFFFICFLWLYNKKIIS